jgi:hypothetical protein
MFAVFLAPHDRASELVSLVTDLAWPLVLVIALLLFWPQVRDLVSKVARSFLGPPSAVVIPVDLGVPPPLLVTQRMDEGLAATPGYDRWNTGPRPFCLLQSPGRIMRGLERAWRQPEVTGEHADDLGHR